VRVIRHALGACGLLLSRLWHCIAILLLRIVAIFGAMLSVLVGILIERQARVLKGRRIGLICLLLRLLLLLLAGCADRGSLGHDRKEWLCVSRQ
jgi:hypothetical protein